MKALLFLAILMNSVLCLGKMKDNHSSGATLKFGQTRVFLPLEISDKTLGMKYLESKIETDDLNTMKFSTPQFSRQLENDVPVVLIKNFDAVKTPTEDMSQQGQKGKPEKLKLKNGFLYFWMTDSIGSSNYYYLQNPANKEMAIKIGPIAGIVASKINFHWNKVKWSKADRE